MRRNFIDRKVLGGRIIDACDKKGISVIELAKRINRPAMHVYRISIGATYSPNLKTLQLICEELGFTMDYLLGIEDEKKAQLEAQQKAQQKAQQEE